MTRYLFSLLFLLSVFSTSLTANEQEVPCSLIIENAWIAEAPPVSKVMVAYMTIKNIDEQEVKVVRAESDMFSSIEFHETKHEDGMARMIRHNNLSIPAHSSIELKRGARHLMLFNPTKHLKAGDTVTIKLTTASHSSKTVDMPVKKSQF